MSPELLEVYLKGLEEIGEEITKQFSDEKNQKGRNKKGIE
jgi:hypothetical protein